MKIFRKCLELDRSRPLMWLLLGCLGWSCMAYAEIASPLPTEAMVKKVIPTIVQVRATTTEGISSAAGVLVDSSGVVATNLHAIRGATTAAIKLASGEEFDDVKVVGFDDKRDLVLLKCAGFGLPTASLGNSDEVEVGQTVIAIGHPAGLEDTVTKGIVSAIRILESGVKVIQTDAAASPGNSGGPLVNERGDVIGIVSFGSTEKSLIFAYPINYVRGLLAHQTAVSLAELSGKLASQKDLFSGSATVGLSGRWKSLQSATLKTLREDGEYVYGEGGLPGGIAVTYELKKQSDGTYEGKARGAGTCSYFNAWKGWAGRTIQKSCVLESSITFVSVSPSRIEGRIENREAPSDTGSRAFREWCDSCGTSVEPRWTSFTWIRSE